mmetsp:Transcript_71952/g.164851  ORF Transcript_71952/g.164851 Transcript_71952/m.164851 type:complete len:336 (-) Transcript_71952:821-1828(-)
MSAKNCCTANSRATPSTLGLKWTLKDMTCVKSLRLCLHGVIPRPAALKSLQCLLGHGGEKSCDLLCLGDLAVGGQDARELDQNVPILGDEERRLAEHLLSSVRDIVGGVEIDKRRAGQEALRPQPHRGLACATVEVAHRLPEHLDRALCLGHPHVVVGDPRTELVENGGCHTHPRARFVHSIHAITGRRCQLERRFGLSRISNSEERPPALKSDGEDAVWRPIRSQDRQHSAVRRRCFIHLALEGESVAEQPGREGIFGRDSLNERSCLDLCPFREGRWQGLAGRQEGEERFHAPLRRVPLPAILEHLGVHVLSEGIEALQMEQRLLRIQPQHRA